MAPFSKEDKILIKSLYECKGYNAWQFITDRLLVKLRKFGTCRQATGQQQTKQCTYWWKRQHMHYFRYAVWETITW